MTILAWDGRYLVADSQAIFGDILRTATKLHYDEDLQIGYAVSGCQSHMKPLVLWHKNGQDPESYPGFQATGDWSTLVVADRSGSRFYSNNPYHTEIMDKYGAWGSGCEVAMGVMRHQEVSGCKVSAFIAAQIACDVLYCCGHPVHFIDLVKGTVSDDKILALRG